MIEDRLNQILPAITQETFLANQGLGNELGFWIFDYAPEEERVVNRFLHDTILPSLQRQASPLKVIHIDLFAFVIDLLESRKLLQGSLKMQESRGNRALLDALRPVLREDKLAERFSAHIALGQCDLIIMSGVGAVYPMLRTHTLLSALHAHLQSVPLLVFYPGQYNGHALKLFNKLPEDNYYRAFQLVS